MNQNELTIVKPEVQRSDTLFQPAFPWTILLSFAFVILAFIGIGGAGAKLLNVLYPLASFAIGWFLYFRYPLLYNGFVWWLFFLTPFIRRVCDWKIGAFTPSGSSYILLAPFLVALISANTAAVNLPKIREQSSAPLVLPLIAVIYGYLVGIARGEDLIETTVDFLSWITPILFGYHLYVNWSRYPLYIKNIQRVFLWGSLIMGAYGIYQFLVAPEWDRLWLIGADMTSAGKPEPLGMRVWSTLNSQGPFGEYISTGLLILLNCKGVLVAPAAGAGALALLLSLVRTAWIGLIASMISLSVFLSAKQKKQIFIALVILVIIVIPLINMEPFSSAIMGRLQTMTNLQEDGSGQERRVMFALLIDGALSEVVGQGLGSVGADNALIVLLTNLGWIGAIPYVGGLLFSSLLIFTARDNKNDLMIAIIRAILIKSLISLIAGANMLGAQGMILWGFIGLGLAGRKYYLNYYQQQILLLETNKIQTSN